MTAILHAEAKKLQQGALLVTGAMGLIVGFFLAVFPALREEADLIEEAYPDFMIDMLGFEQIHTIEGFSAGYIYPLVWTVFIGIYVAYISGGLIAGDIESRQMDLTLSTPVSRETVLAQKVAALWLPLALVNLGLMAVMYVGSILVGDRFELLDLLMVHLLSIPYLLVCAGIGLVLSVVIDRTGTAQMGALGIVFMLWLIDGLSLMEPEYEWIGDFTPSRYFDPNEILIRQEYSFLDASVLLAAFIVLVGVSVVLFVRRDI